MKAQEIDKYPKLILVTVENSEELDKLIEISGGLDHIDAGEVLPNALETITRREGKEESTKPPVPKKEKRHYKKHHVFSKNDPENEDDEPKEKRKYKKRKNPEEAESDKPEEKEDIKPTGKVWRNQGKEKNEKHERMEKAKELISKGATAREAATKIWGSCHIGKAMTVLVEEEMNRPHNKADKEPVILDQASLEAEVLEYLQGGPAKPRQICKNVRGDEIEVDHALHELRFAGKVVKDGPKYMIKGWEPKEEPEQNDELEQEEEQDDPPKVPDEPEEEDDDDGADAEAAKVDRPELAKPEFKTHSERIKEGQERRKKTDKEMGGCITQFAEFCKAYTGRKEGFDIDTLREAIDASEAAREKMIEMLNHRDEWLKDKLEGAYGIKLSEYRDEGIKKFLVEAAK